MTIRILLADDQSLILEGIKAILEPEPEIEVVGTAQDGKIAIAKVKKLRPDILLIDIEMPEMNGILATKYICKYLPDTKVIVLTSHKDQDYIAEALLAGASGYLWKGNLIEDLKQEIYSFGRGYSSVKAKLLTVEDGLVQAPPFSDRERVTQAAERDSKINIVKYQEKVVRFKKYRKNIYKPSVKHTKLLRWNSELPESISKDTPANIFLKTLSGGRKNASRQRCLYTKRSYHKGTMSEGIFLGNPLGQPKSRKTYNRQPANPDLTKTSLAPTFKSPTTRKIRATNPKASSLQSIYSALGFERRKYLRKIIWLLLRIFSIILLIVILAG